jgi:hypothetical protein
VTRLPPVNTARRIRRRLSHQWVSPKAAWYLLWRIYRVFEGTFMSEALDEEVGRFTELTFFRWVFRITLSCSRGEAGSHQSAISKNFRFTYPSHFPFILGQVLSTDISPSVRGPAVGPILTLCSKRGLLSALYDPRSTT